MGARTTWTSRVRTASGIHAIDVYAYGKHNCTVCPIELLNCGNEVGVSRLAKLSTFELYTYRLRLQSTREICVYTAMSKLFQVYLTITVLSSRFADSLHFFHCARTNLFIAQKKLACVLRSSPAKKHFCLIVLECRFGWLLADQECALWRQRCGGTEGVRSVSVLIGFLESVPFQFSRQTFLFYYSAVSEVFSTSFSRKTWTTTMLQNQLVVCSS